MTKPPLLLVNGYAATGEDWDPTFLAALSASFEVIHPGNRGVGGGELGEGELTVDAMAADLEALLESRGIGCLPVVGWSMGGFVAQRLALRAPQRVSGLGLLSTDPGGPEAILPAAGAWTRLTDASGTPREQASRLISLLFPPPLAAEIDGEFGEAVAAARGELAPAALRAQEAAMVAWHAEPQPSPVEPPPTIIVHGELDEVIPAANAELLASRWRARGAEVLAGCGHAAMAQEPERVAALISSHCLGSS